MTPLYRFATNYLQLLEIVNRSLGSPEEEQGLVVANDSDTDRAYMLGMSVQLNSVLKFVLHFSLY